MMTPALKKVLKRLEELPEKQQDLIAEIIEIQIEAPEASDSSVLVKMAAEARALHKAGKTIALDC